MPATEQAPIRGLSNDELKFISRSLSGDVYELFRDEIPILKSHFHLHVETLVSAISDASTDLGRAASYHSKSGASIARVAGYVGWWVAYARPIQLSDTARASEYNEIVAKDLLGINSIFAVFCVRALMGKKTIPAKLLGDMRYTFQYRPRYDGEAIAMLLINSTNGS